MDKPSITDIKDGKPIRLSRLNAALPAIRDVIEEGLYLDGTPLTTQPVKYRKNPDEHTHGLIVGYAAFLSFKKTMQDKGLTIQVSAPQTARQMVQQALKNTQQGSDHIFFDGDPDAKFLTIGGAGNKPATCFVLLSPRLAQTYRHTEIDLSNLHQLDVNPLMDQHMEEVFDDKKAPYVKRPRGTFIPTRDIRHASKRQIADVVNEGKVAWIGNGSVAAIPCDVALKLKARIYPNNGHIIKQETSEGLSSANGRIFEEIRTQDVFYRIHDTQHGKNDALFTIVPDHVIRFLNLSHDGDILDFRPTPLSDFRAAQNVWVHTDLQTTKVIFAKSVEPNGRNLRIGEPEEVAHLVRRALGFARAAHATINGKKFKCIGEFEIDRNVRPKDITFADTFYLQSRFNDRGHATKTEGALLCRPHFGEFILSTTKDLRIHAAEREFVLAAV